MKSAPVPTLGARERGACCAPPHASCGQMVPELITRPFMSLASFRRPHRIGLSMPHAHAIPQPVYTSPTRVPFVFAELVTNPSFPSPPPSRITPNILELSSLLLPATQPTGRRTRFTYTMHCILALNWPILDGHTLSAILVSKFCLFYHTTPSTLCTGTVETRKLPLHQFPTGPTIIPSSTALSILRRNIYLASSSIGTGNLYHFKNPPDFRLPFDPLYSGSPSSSAGKPRAAPFVIGYHSSGKVFDFPEIKNTILASPCSTHIARAVYYC
ncbi:uncharacterized protein FOMMEDRAFT_161101 [Fomitiporia mediterranea MF3/22]|uniref:uncharacterized protein n=1 Tax=Fomitiporia mediterranea (strain MF3/22) TaxID=694068 RepID=UPI0004407936|nr:uncharacterized protein FOMMEDRAFT_161101 [Fomitiporia mediterranea MF3/22]EJC98911.1 hypothetical protein FOMMEDRAFT_161101 [Fomitiporia mediterranea MF3/22]